MKDMSEEGYESLIGKKDILGRRELKQLITTGLSLFELPALDYYILNDLALYSDSKEPSLYAVLLCLLSACHEGSLCLVLDPRGDGAVRTKLKLLTGEKGLEMESDRIIDDFISSALKGGFSKILGTEETDYKPLILKTFTNGCYGLYFQKYYIYESYVRKYLFQILDRPGIDLLENAGQKKKDELDKLIGTNIFGGRSGLNERQKEACYRALKHNFVIISGGPGTGKTSVVSMLLSAFLTVDPGLTIALAAPTGRAAKKMTESIKSGLPPSCLKDANPVGKTILDLEGKTLHRLLGYSPAAGTFSYSSDNRLKLDVIVIDEVSMVDIEMMSHLLSALPERARILFLGDKDQLPSVDAGAVLGEMINHPAMTERIVMLKETHRNQGELYQASVLINKSDIPGLFKIMKKISLPPAQETSRSAGGTAELFTGLADNTCYYINTPEFADIKSTISFYTAVLESWLHFFYLSRGYIKLCKESYTPLEVPKLDALFEGFIDSCKILAVLKKGITGTRYINTYLTGVLNKHLGGLRPETVLFPGIPIIITANNYRLDLFNGDVGVILREDNSFKAFFKKSGGYVSFPLHLLSSFETAFAITVHKSQGSEYGSVMVTLPEDKKNPLLTREILYTGLTRAKKRALLLGSEEIIQSAASKKISRESGLNR